MAKSPKDDYEVGYGRPPRSTQFQPGQSGNPKGRPKGSLNLATALNRAIHERVTVIERGRQKSRYSRFWATASIAARSVTRVRFMLASTKRLSTKTFGTLFRRHGIELANARPAIAPNQPVRYVA